jgi:hypothetical protein
MLVGNDKRHDCPTHSNDLIEDGGAGRCARDDERLADGRTTLHGIFTRSKGFIEHTLRVQAKTPAQ